jgi:peptidylprolyl isomerase
MRSVIALCVPIVALGLVSCAGGDESSEATATSAQRDATKARFSMSAAEIAKLPKIEIRKRNDPPPRKLVVNDLRQGSGETVRPKDVILVDYFSVTYDEAMERKHSGEFPRTKFGLDSVVKGWELGVPGMKVGGRRELVVPSNLAYGTGAVIYVIDLLEIGPR